MTRKTEASGTRRQRVRERAVDLRILIAILCVLGLVLTALAAAPDVALAKKPTPPDPPADLPVIDSIDPNTAPVGTVVTITGSYFGEPDRDSFVEFPRDNGKRIEAQAISWSDTAIEVIVPDRAGVGDVMVIVSGAESNGYFFVTGDPAALPVLDSLSIYAAPQGTDITLSGSYFGDTKGSSWVSFAGTRGNIVSWSDTEIVVTVPNGAESGYVGVVVNDISSNGLYFIPHWLPVVDALSSTWGEPGDAVTITGTGFNDVQGDGYPVFSGVPADVLSWSDTEVVALVPEGAAAGYAGIVQWDVVSNGKYFVPHGLPGIAELSSIWAVVGDTVSVKGTNFLDSPGTLTVDGAPIDSIVSWSDTEVVFEAPPTVTSGWVGVHQDGMTSNGVWINIAPRIDTISSWWAAPGDQLTITGSGFGPTQEDAWVSVARVPCDVVSWSESEIVVTIPADGLTGYVGVHRAPALSNGKWLVVSSQATIDSVNRSFVQPGQELVITGSQFGTPRASSVVKIAGTPCSIVSWTDTEIVAVVPEGVTAGYVGVYKQGISSNGKWVRVGQPIPTVTGISSWWGEPGDAVTITGWGFGPEQGEGYPVFAGVPGTVLSWSDTEVVAVVPEGSSTGYAGIVQSGVTSNGKYFMPFHPPQITSLSHSTASVGELVTVTGLGFRDAPGTLTLAGAQVDTITSWTDTQIVFEVPAGATSGYIGVTHDDKTSNGAWLGIVVP